MTAWRRVEDWYKLHIREALYELLLDTGIVELLINSFLHLRTDIDKNTHHNNNNCYYTTTTTLTTQLHISSKETFMYCCSVYCCVKAWSVCINIQI